METRQLQTQLKFKQLTEQGSFEGYASVFGNADSYGDIVQPGAFAASIASHKQQGSMPKLLWQHDWMEPIGIFTDMMEDGTGLFVCGQLALDTQRGRECYSLLKMGALDGLSIGYVSKRWEYDAETGLTKLLEVELWETSIVTFPANGLARLTGVKGDLPTTEREFERTLRALGFSKAAARGITKNGFDAGRDAQEADDLIGRDAQGDSEALTKEVQALLQTLTH